MKKITVLIACLLLAFVFFAGCNKVNNVEGNSSDISSDYTGYQPPTEEKKPEDASSEDTTDENLNVEEENTNSSSEEPTSEQTSELPESQSGEQEPEEVN